MAQLSYGFLMDVASEGLLADCGFKNCLSPRAFADIPVGRGVAKVVGEDYAVRLPAQNQSTVVLDADLVTSNSIAVSVNGVALTPIVFAVSHDDTMDAIAALIEAQPNIDTAVVSDPNNRTITVTAEQGEVAIVDSFVVTLGASQATATITNGTQDSFYGVALRIQNKMNLLDPNSGSDGPAPYYTGEVVSLLTRGRVYVFVDQEVTSDDPVYMRFVDGGGDSLIGRFRKDDDSGKAILVPDARYTVGASAGGLATLEINMP